jgi:tetratricopeptide (TPR) repeat protein
MRVPAEDLEKGYLAAAHLLPDEDKPLSLLTGLHPKDRGKRLELLGAVVADNPKAVWARVWIAYILRKEEPVDAEKALATLRDAEKIAPDNSQVHSQIAQLLKDTGAAAQALEEFTLSVEKGAPGATVAESNAIDEILHADAKIPLAARERGYDAVVAKNPHDGRYGNNAGLWFRDAGKEYRKSLKYYLAAVKAAPDDQDFVNDAALIYLFHVTDRKDACLPMFEHVVALVEKDGQPPARGYWDTLENLCKYWFEKGEYEKVVACADKRASPKATMNGQPYPSMKAALYRAQALAKLDKPRK